MIRTFLALELPTAFKKELITRINNFKAYNSSGVKWVEDKNLHITLQFIGDTREDHIKELAEKFHRIILDFKQAHLQNPQIQLIPGKHPRILWVNFDAVNQDIYKISRKIKSEIANLGYRLDKKPLRIHATLGRIKKRLSEILINKILSSEISIKQIVITRATYYQSILRSDGPVYHEIASYDFKKE